MRPPHKRDEINPKKLTCLFKSEWDNSLGTKSMHMCIDGTPRTRIGINCFG